MALVGGSALGAEHKASVNLHDQGVTTPRFKRTNPGPLDGVSVLLPKPGSTYTQLPLSLLI